MNDPGNNGKHREMLLLSPPSPILLLTAGEERSIIRQLDMFSFQTPTMSTLDVQRCKVKPINHLTAARMVETYHYAHRIPSIIAAIGLYVDDVLAGCITYGSPASRQAVNLCGPQYSRHVIELTRLFVFDWCGRNTESWFIGQSFDVLQKIWPEYFILLSYADASQDHLGYIYQATNWLYTGQTSPERTGYIINGKFIHRRTVNQLYGSSSEAVVKSRCPNAELVIDIGKYRYVYFLGNKRQRKMLRAALQWPVSSYPKLTIA